MSLVPDAQEAELVEEDVDLASMTLDELAARVNSEHALVGASIQAASERLSWGLLHGIRSGEALLNARERVQVGYWEEWVSENTELSMASVQKYTRWATYKTQILSSEQPLSSDTIGSYLRGLPSCYVPTVRTARPPEVIQEVKRLARQGLKPAEIAELVDMTQGAVRYHIDPAMRSRKRAMQAERRRRQSAERKALAEKEKADAIRKAGGNISAAYSYIRKALAELDAALGDATDTEVRTALRAAIAGAHKAEDYIGKAVRSQ